MTSDPKGWAWTSVGIAMVAIFLFSADPASHAHSLRLVGGVVRYFAAGIHEGRVIEIHAYVRKACHVGLYAVLGALAYRAIRGSSPRPLSLAATAAFALGMVTLYAATDEIHQAFVPGRYASAKDVLLDSMGATLGVAAISAGRFFRPRPGVSRPS